MIAASARAAPYSYQAGCTCTATSNGADQSLPAAGATQLQSVVPRWQVRVGSHSPRRRRLKPILVKALQAVSVAPLIRIGEIQGGKTRSQSCGPGIRPFSPELKRDCEEASLRVPTRTSVTTMGGASAAGVRRSGCTTIGRSDRQNRRSPAGSGIRITGERNRQYPLPARAKRPDCKAVGLDARQSAVGACPDIAVDVLQQGVDAVFAVARRFASVAGKSDGRPRRAAARPGCHDRTSPPRSRPLRSVSIELMYPPGNRLGFLGRLKDA